MSNLDYYLDCIAWNLMSPNDGVNYAEFDSIKDYVLHIMRLNNPYFNKICQNDQLFGSVSHNIRINDDEEFDVLMELKFPAHTRIRQVACQDRPGFVHLDFTQAICDNMIDYRLANNQLNYLNRITLNKWLHTVFANAFDRYGTRVSTGNESYTLRYEWRGITYTVYAQSSMRRFAIDFVPAIKIVRPNSSTWYAVPKPAFPPANMNSFTFMIQDSQAEMDKLNRCGSSVKDALLLLQGLRNNRGLHKLRCYYMVTAAIWLANRVGYSTVKKMSVRNVFLTLLSDLCDAFFEQHLSYLWNPNCNLLEIFSSSELMNYGNCLCKAYNTLVSYQHQPSLTYQRCLTHFN